MSQVIRKPFVFMRHGETALNQQGLVCGSIDAPLNYRGEEQASHAQPLLKRAWSIVVTTERQRAQQTAELAVPHQRAEIWPLLNERNWGDIEGMPTTEMPPQEMTPPNGEPWLEFRERVLTALNTLLDQYELPLIVAHSGVYQVIASELANSEHQERPRNAQPILFKPNPDSSFWSVSPYSVAPK